MKHRSLFSPIAERADTNPDEVAIIFIENDGREREITAKQLVHEAAAFCQACRASKLSSEDIVVIALPHSTEMIHSFWGALMMGATPSMFPFPFPSPGLETVKRQIRESVSSSGARAVVTTAGLADAFSDALEGLDCQVINVEHVRPLAESQIGTVEPSPTSDEQIAYLQYTSGTTGLQKGVLLSHRAILKFISMYGRAMQLSQGDTFINWSPLYHDGGLFSATVTPLVIGVPTVLMSHMKWIRRPISFLHLIAKHKATLTWMPNSALNHTVQVSREKDLEGLDLSSLRVLLCSGEPVRHESVELFVRTFSPYGLKEEAMITGYGMAENTLAVTLCEPGRRAAVDFVDVQSEPGKAIAAPGTADNPALVAYLSCGRVVEGTQMAIVDEAGNRLGERAVGEIVFKGDTLFSGYHRNAAATESSMSDGWHCSGDMGYLADGQLYVCGRKKDMIIAGGRNIYPEDLELVVNSVTGVQPDRAVAIGVFDERLGTEKVVVICELKRTVRQDDHGQIRAEIRRRVLSEMNVALGDVILEKRGWVVKTPSGKISRAKNLQKYLSTIKEAER